MFGTISYRRPVLALASVITGVALLASPAAAGWQPEKPIRMVIAFGPGGGADSLARLIAEQIGETRGWTVVPENRPGAGGAVMARLVMSAAPNGYTIGMGTTSNIASNPVLREELTFGPEDFDFLGSVAQPQNVIVTRADAPFSTLEEMAAYARDVAARENRTLSIGAMGAMLQRLAERIAGHYDIRLRVVPTRGGAEVLTQLLGGHIDLGFNGGAHHQYLRSGDLKVIVNLNDDPLVVTPDVKNLRDHGINFATYNYFQFQAPKGLPTDIKAALVEAIAAAVESEKVAELAERRMEMQLINLGPQRLREVAEDSVKSAKWLLEKD